MYLVLLLQLHLPMSTRTHILQIGSNRYQTKALSPPIELAFVLDEPPQTLVLILQASLCEPLGHIEVQQTQV